ncbi:peptidase C39 family protein [Sporomusa malonica]|uniref:Predicted double-glycine peptidase n=1 Tax=Sporomusa malonica TaxID=112901 RepID=A0A1W2DJK0_9FIRM|nr:peptidase C39 family protein [Sporomusa malonica]SMC97619.1 Predicted double-glycine peptidase [Sporomusa malonica]
MFIKLGNVNRWKTAMYGFILLACFTTASLVGEELILPPPNSTGAANYYEMIPNQYYLSLGVKGYQQTTDYTCGPAAVMSLLHWYKVLNDQSMNQATEMLIAKEMGTGDIDSKYPGTTPQQMESWLKKNGFEVRLGYNGTLEMLRENLKQGIPTLIEWIDWGGHWVVVTGYYAAYESPEKGVDTIFFADPAVHWTTVNNPDGISSFNAWRFRDMWFDAQYIKPGHLVKNIYIVAVPRKTQ